MILSRPKLVNILASFHKTIDNLVALQEHNASRALIKKMEINDLQSDVDELYEDNDTAKSVEAKLRELIS